VTCQEIRDLFSARVDEALTPAERERLDTHLAACADCGREWQRFAATVGLLRAVEPARAPAGFVDRVLTARPQPWYRRLGHGLFVPWPVKLPLEAAALVLIAGLAVVIFQRSPGLQQAARAPEAPPPVTAPAERAQREPAQPAAGGDRSRDVEPERSGQLSKDAPSPRRAEPPAAADSRSDVAAGTEGKYAAQTPPAARESRPAEPEASGQTGAERRAKEAPPAALGRQGQRDAARSAPDTTAAPPDGQKAAKVEGLMSRTEAPVVPADVEARLAAPNRAAAERRIRALVARLGGIVTGPGPETLEVSVPRGVWDELARELAGLGTLRIDRRPADLPPTVRLTLRLE